MHCPQCGKPTPEAAAVCPFCGHALETSRSAAGKPMAQTMVGIPQAAAIVARMAAAAAARGEAVDVSDEAATLALNRAANGNGNGGVAGAVRAAHANPNPHAGTMLGLSPAAGAQGFPASFDQEQAAKTVVGMRSPEGAAPSARADGSGEAFDPNVQTRVGFRPLTGAGKAAAPVAAPAPAPGRAAQPSSRQAPAPLRSPDVPAPGSGRALIAPHEGERRVLLELPPSDELGATVAPQAAPPIAPAKRLKAHALNAPRIAIPPLKPPKVQKSLKPQARRGQRATAALLAGAGVIAAGAVVFAVLWSGRSPLAARVRTDAAGAEVVELSCPSCPDGTVLTAGQSTATVTGAVAVLAPDKPLSPGDNRLKVRIDRPSNGRDETVNITATVAYRIRPDLSALSADRPAIQVAIEAAKGTQVKLDGRAVPLYAGRATESFDVTDACTGLAAEATSLSRQIPYIVTTPDGEEKGSVSVVVGVVPLELEAPGPNVVIDGPSFVIAGRTLKGAEFVAAGKPIPVKPDGSFAHVMNVSSVGATQIDVRAKFAGMAPRIVKIKVRRVDSLETAAREFAAESPVTLASLGPGVAQSAGKAIVVAGSILDVQREGRRTIMILDVGPPGGCNGCSAKLVLGAESAAQVGDKITAYGHIVRSVRLPERGEIPEIQVDFTLKGLR